MNFLNMLFAAMHVANTVDMNRLGTDPEYRQAVISELCGESDTPKSHNGDPANRNDGPRSLPRAA